MIKKEKEQKNKFILTGNFRIRKPALNMNFQLMKN